jgi:hypothetical protein
MAQLQETKTNALGIRITDSELRRLKAIKDGLGLPSMTNTTLAHDLLVMGMEQMEARSSGKGEEPREPKPGKRSPKTAEAGK